MTSSRSAKKKRPLPVIDLGQLLGHSNARIKSSNVADNGDKEHANPPKKRQAPRMAPSSTLQAAGLSHLQSDDEPRHPGASIQGLASMEGLSFYESLMLGPSVPCDDTGNHGTVDDSSLAVAMSDTWNPSVMQEETFLPVQRDMRGNEMLLLQEMQSHCFADSKMPAESHELAPNGSNEAQQQLRTDTPELLQVDPTKADKVDDTKEGKAGSTNTRQVMPNRNICVPLVPVPSVCSSTSEDVQSVSLPSFQQLINYNYFGQHASKDGTKPCVMCAVTCQYISLKQDRKDDNPFILRNRKGICSVCLDTVWRVVDSRIEIRFCYECKTFHPWAAFQRGNGQMVKLCNSCRCRTNTRQRKRRASIGTGKAVAANSPTGTLRCVVLPQPVKLPPPRSLEEAPDTPLPTFQQIANYPATLRKKPDKRGNKCCVMCSKSLPYLSRSDQNGPDHRIVLDNKGVCTVCEAAVWKLVETGAVIKMCNQCRHFHPLVSFLGKDSKVKKYCSHCRRVAASRCQKKHTTAVAATAVASDAREHVAEDFP